MREGSKLELLFTVFIQILHLLFCRNELPYVIDSVKEVNFVSPTGREISFDAYGNAKSGYTLFNYVKNQDSGDGNQTYSYVKVW